MAGRAKGPGRNRELSSALENNKLQWGSCRGAFNWMKWPLLRVHFIFLCLRWRLLIMTTEANTESYRQQDEEGRMEIDGEKVTPPPAVCHTTDQRDTGRQDAIILWLSTRRPYVRAGCSRAGIQGKSHRMNFDTHLLICWAILGLNSDPLRQHQYENQHRWL